MDADLTLAMVGAMNTLWRAHPVQATLSNLSAVVPLLNRGYIRKAEPGAQITTLTRYCLTHAGAVAYCEAAASLGIDPDQPIKED